MAFALLQVAECQLGEFMATEADTYDREVFEGMGVKTIWVDRFDDVPDIISAIAR
jgi:hypothetical protein